MDYPVIQQKIFSHLSVQFCNSVFVNKLLNECEAVDMTNLKDQKVKELHALCSYIKGESSETCLEVLFELRDVLGGHGYSIYSQFPRFIRDNVVQTTWEGSNGVLIQQTAKFLLTQFSKYIQKGTIAIESFAFLKEMEDEA